MKIFFLFLIEWVLILLFSDLRWTLFEIQMYQMQFDFGFFLLWNLFTE